MEEREREDVGDVEKEWDLRVERGRQGAGAGRRGGGGGGGYGDMFPSAQKAATTVSEWGGCQSPMHSLAIVSVRCGGVWRRVEGEAAAVLTLNQIPGQDTPGFSRDDRRQQKTHGGRDLCRSVLGAGETPIVYCVGRCLHALDTGYYCPLPSDKRHFALFSIQKKTKRQERKDTKATQVPQEELSIIPSRSRRNTLTNRCTTLTMVSMYEYPMAKRHATKNLEF